MAKERIIELQKSLRIARSALERIASGHAGNPMSVADNALIEMWKLDKKQPLQTILGHERAKQ